MTAEIKALDTQTRRATQNILLLAPDLVPAAQAQIRDWNARRQQAAIELRTAQATNPVEDMEAIIAHIERSLWNLGEAQHTNDRDTLRQALRSCILRVQLHFEKQQRAKYNRYFFRHGTATIYTGNAISISTSLTTIERNELKDHDDCAGLRQIRIVIRSGNSRRACNSQVVCRSMKSRNAR